MFLNLAAAWKDMALQLEDEGVSKDAIEDCRRGFYCGACAMMAAQTNIVKQHKEKHARILLDALGDEIETFFDEMRVKA